MLPSDGQAVAVAPGAPPATVLEKILRSFSVITMLMTVPQVLVVWMGRNASGVSLACIGWILLDLAIVIGVLVHR